MPNAPAGSVTLTGNEPVIRIASDLGYANASHFATAFRKQFGINPSTLKKGTRGRSFQGALRQRLRRTLTS
nr:helix-turn-helix domain-containing protein [Pseudomonas azotoformans]